MKIGNTIKHGTYNGIPIEWRVIDVCGDKALIITETIIEERVYHYEMEDTTWAECDLQKYLNGEFYNTCFNATEKAKILRTHVSTPNTIYTVKSGKEYNLGGGADIDNYVFLLSVNEIKNIGYFDMKYIPLEDTRLNKYSYSFDVYPAEIPQSEKLITKYGNSDGILFWWLRSPGEDSYYAAYVDHIGHVMIDGYRVFDSLSVRPVLWLNLKP